ncbi:MAG: hypothetical protein PHU21_10330, partial [Elusimicrobia bacterium]|nr:hypothetical protein [Elusimicrobiota bacterium]
AVGASFAGKLMIGVGAAALLAGLGLYAYQRLHGTGSERPMPVLGPISDGIRVHRTPSDERLRLAARAGHGQFQFDSPESGAVSTPAGEEDGKAADGAAGAAGAAGGGTGKTPWGEILSGFQPKAGFGSQGFSGMTSGSSGYGGQGLFSSLTGAGARGGGSGGAAPSLRNYGQKGKLSGAFAKGSTRSSNARALSTRGIRTSRAFAQLRYARGQSVLAARGGSSEQGMRATALDAFNQNQTQGGQIGAVDSPVPVNPPGGAGSGGGEYGTAPVLGDTNPTALPDQPVSPPGAVDPGQKQNYQSPMDAIKQLAAMAAKLKQISMILIALGLMLIALGIALMCNPYTFGAGCAVLAAGVAVLAMGYMMLMMAKQMGAQAKAMGEQLSAAMGQQYEQENIQACVDQAVAAGTDPNACNSPHNNDNTHNDHTTISEDVEAERNSEAKYEDDGTPVFQE